MNQLRDDGDTRAALLQAAAEAFAEKGFAGASIREITARANANLGAVTYHFGSKRELYEAVIVSQVEPLVERITAAATGSGSALDRAETVVRTYFDFLAANPGVLKLLMQVVVLGGPPPQVAVVSLTRMHGALMRLVEEGQTAGEVRAGEAAVMAISIVSQPIHVMLMRGMLEALMGADLLDPREREPFVRNAAAFVRGGLSREDD